MELVHLFAAGPLRYPLTAPLPIRASGSVIPLRQVNKDRTRPSHIRLCDERCVVTRLVLDPTTASQVLILEEKAQRKPQKCASC